MKVLCKKTVKNVLRFKKGEWYEIDENEYTRDNCGIIDSCFIRTIDGGSRFYYDNFIFDDHPFTIYEKERMYSIYFFTPQEIRKRKLNKLFK